MSAMASGPSCVAGERGEEVPLTSLVLSEPLSDTPAMASPCITPCDEHAITSGLEGAPE